MIKAFSLWNKHFLEIIKNKRKTNTAPGLHSLCCQVFLGVLQAHWTPHGNHLWVQQDLKLSCILWHFLHMHNRLIRVFFGIWIMPQRRRTIKSLQAPGFRLCHSEGKFLGSRIFPCAGNEVAAAAHHNLPPCPKLKMILCLISWANSCVPASHRTICGSL